MKKEEKIGGKLKRWASEHKRLSIVIASVFLILCVTSTVAIVVLFNRTQPTGGSNHPAYNPITKEADKVVYYRNVANSKNKVLLTLNRGWYFTLEGDGINKSGEYFLKDDVITLDFVRDKDQTASVKIINENELSVLLQGASNPSTFRKMINFTVSFETNGGSAINSLTVINGETVSEPVAPTKKNNTFAGWYKDAKCTIPFNFDADPIASNTVIYAKWTDSSANTP